MNILDIFRSRNEELQHMFDFELVQEQQEKVHLKRLAIETCINMIGKTIGQSEFQIRENGRTVKDEMFYKFNLKPNKNQTSSFFWQTVIYKLIYDNECLIVKADDDDLLIADDFTRNQYALYEDTFTNVTIKEYQYKRSFQSSEVVYLKYNNENITKIIDSLFEDYGKLFGRMLEFQLRKNQIRGLVDIEATVNMKDEKNKNAIQGYINRIYKSIENSVHTVIPQQKGFKYSETNGSSSSIPVDEVSKVSDGFLQHVSRAFSIPIALLNGEMADVEKQTKNYMVFCINPLIKKISDELNAKFVSKDDYLKGKRISIKTSSYESIFDIAANVDKLISSGAFTGNELRDELGYERSDDPMLDKHFITKNYAVTEEDTLKGGENE